MTFPSEEGRGGVERGQVKGYTPRVERPHFLLTPLHYYSQQLQNGSGMRANFLLVIPNASIPNMLALLLTHGPRCWFFTVGRSFLEEQMMKRVEDHLGKPPRLHHLPCHHFLQLLSLYSPTGPEPDMGVGDEEIMFNRPCSFTSG